jgi:hypothetical protein
MHSCGIIYVPSFIKIGSGRQKLEGDSQDTQMTRRSHENIRHVHKVSCPPVPQLANLILREATGHK